MTPKKDSRRVIEYAREQGYVVTPTTGSHWKAVHPCGAVVVLTNTIKNEAMSRREISRLRTEKARRIA